jgi:hypothetical protein
MSTNHWLRHDELIHIEKSYMGTIRSSNQTGNGMHGWDWEW